MKSSQSDTAAGAFREIPDTNQSSRQPALRFGEYIARLKGTLARVFHADSDSDKQSIQRRLPPPILREIMECNPLAAFVPSEYGGRGSRISERLTVLEAASYESLALGLTFGINWALFLQPVAKHARHDVKTSVFSRFIDEQALGGLMITEPGHGTDALNMQTSFVDEDDHYRIEGTKHWGGLTGMADYWLVAARRRTPAGNLKRDISFLVCDSSVPDQTIEVEEVFENLGLYQIPYGRNRIDVTVPKSHRLEPATSGITMMLDMLHRSRMQFPGIGHGFIKRMLDEALAHCRSRFVGGRSLFSYDQVQHRLARIQASFTISSAMCAHSSENAALEEDLSSRGVEANSIKTVMSDMMQDAAQSLLQLVGAKGYRLDHVAGRATVDSRPFQIFEGSNDVLYAQISEGIVRLMDRARETNLYRFLTGHHLTSRAAGHFRQMLDFRLTELPQRRLVDLGRALSRIVSMEWVIKLGDRGFRSDLIANSVATLREEVAGFVHSFSSRAGTNAVKDYEAGASWFSLV